MVLLLLYLCLNFFLVVWGQVGGEWKLLCFDSVGYKFGKSFGVIRIKVGVILFFVWKMSVFFGFYLQVQFF